jgi:two-component sensor histidine kinase
MLLALVNEHSASAPVLPLSRPSTTQVAAGLIDVLRRLSAAGSIDEIMQVAVHAALRLLGADGATFVLREGDVCHYAEEEAIAPLWKGKRFSADACVSGWCMKRGQAVAIGDIYQDDRVPLDAYRETFVRSLVMAPVCQEDPIAALGAYWSRPRAPTPSELDLLQTIANAASLSVAYVELRRERERERHAATASQLNTAAPLRGSRLREWAPARPAGPLQKVLLGLSCTAVAWALRATLSSLLGSELPYATFLGFVLLAAFWGGRLAGFTAALSGGMAAYFTFAHHWPLAEVPVSLLAFWGEAGALTLVAAAMSQSLVRRTAENGRLRVASQELRHRIKNMLQVAQGLAHQIKRSADDVEDFDRKFTEKLDALAQAQALLAEDEAGTAGLAALVDRALSPFAAGGRLHIEPGGEVRLDQQLSVGLALVLNELGTNAVKYGALSTDRGRVELAWTHRNDELRLVWAERDGPPVATPERSGFGTRLLRSAFPRGRADVKVNFDPAGVVCEINFAHV